jgi:hypothetical protein
MEITPLSLIVPDFYVGPNLQAAVNQAAQSPRASVWIPANYPGTDTYTNASNVPVYDMRGAGSATFATSFPVTTAVTVSTGGSITPVSGGVITANSTTASIPGEPGLTAIPVTSGLMAEYRMIEGAGTTVKDYSGNGNDATFAAGGNAPAWAAGNSGGVRFNGAAVEWISCPAALNSALTIMVYINSFNGSSATTPQSIVQGNGNGSSSNAIGLMLSRDCGGTNGSVVSCPFASQYVASYSSNGYKTVAKMTFDGNGVLALTLGASDVIYLNGVAAANNWAAAASAGGQTIGNYQIGGANQNNGSSTGSFTAFVGVVYYAVFWNRVLNAAEIAAASDFMRRAMITRGIQPTLGGNFNTNKNSFVLDGDSIAAGPLGTITLNGSWDITDTGLGGQLLATSSGAAQSASLSVDPIVRPLAERNPIAIWAGTNDNCTTAATCATLVGNFKSYCQNRKLAGYNKCFPITMLSRTGEDTSKNLLNAELRLQWPTFADGLIDMAADTALGADGASANTTFFTDGTHLTTAAKTNDVVPVIQRAINRAYGAKDFSNATVYSSAAAAAASTTAVTQSGSTVTVTFSATPANCLVGNQIVISGVTPTGYNSTAANGAGNGSFAILTSTATQITYTDFTTGLGNATIQGTGVCSQMQDADQYSILNFGAGNFTLQTCVGFTGQNIYIRNINGTASTLVPFGSETITGAGATPTTLAANTTAILQSQLVSSSAAGCNWVRLQ